MRHVLVVDDEPDVCELIRVALESRGYSVEAAHSSADAVKKLTAQHFDVAILDYQMPQGDGIFLYNLLVSMHPGLASRVLFITGVSSEPRLIQFLAQTGSPFLNKPFRIDELLQTVGSLGK